MQLKAHERQSNAHSANPEYHRWSAAQGDDGVESTFTKALQDYERSDLWQSWIGALRVLGTVFVVLIWKNTVSPVNVFLLFSPSPRGLPGFRYPPPRAVNINRCDSKST